MSDENDKLAVLLDDPQIREIVFAIGHSGSPAGPVRLRAVAVEVLDAAGETQRASWLGPGDDNAPASAGLLPAGVVPSVAAYVESDPGEVARQLGQLLPDLLDALTPGGELLPAAELARVMRVDIALDEQSAGVFGE
jgi:uncharacterized protein YidB (DUF937 family)